MKRPGITQRMIAERIGLDQRTVSQALAGRPGIAAATRERVVQAARELGYFPNFSAQAMRVGRHLRIGLLTSTASRFSYLPNDRLKGMQLAAQEAGVGLSLLTLPDVDLADPDRAAAVVGGFGVDGVVLNFGRETPEAAGRLLERFNIPAIAVNNLLPVDCVCLDDRGIAGDTVRHLQASGFTRLVYVPYGPRRARADEGGSAPLHFSEPERQAGACEAARRIGLPFAVLPVAELDAVSVRSCLPASGDDRPAVLCYGDLAAQRVFAAAGGLAVPAIFHFADHAFWDDRLDTAMRAVLMPEAALGSEAVRMLLQRMADGKPVPSRRVGIDPARLAFATSGRSYVELPEGA